MCDISTTMSGSIGSLAAALAKAQGGFTFARKESEAAVSYGGKTANVRKYADLAAVLDAVRAGLSANGLAVIQTPFPQQGGGVLLRTTLAHSSGEWIASEISLPADRMGGIQGWGSALTYARRYALAAMVGIAQDDDDGEAAQQAERTRKAQPAPKPQKPAAQPAPAPQQEGLTEAQRKALFARLNELDAMKAVKEQYKDAAPETRKAAERDAYLALIFKAVGREITSTAELTQAEFHTFMQATEPYDTTPF